MKKLILLISTLVIFSSGLFAFDFFGDRFFEIKAGVDLGLSNNATTIDRILKENLEIDLKDLASRVPDSGFDLSLFAKPGVQTKLAIGPFSLAFQSGLEMHNITNIGDDLFDFLGYGNNLGQTITVDVKDDLDVFAYYQIALGLKFKRFNIKLAPSVFLPLVATSGKIGDITVENDALGNFNLNMNLNAKLYSVVDIQKIREMEIDPYALIKNAGYDLAGQLDLPLSKKLLVSAYARVPLVPGTLNTVSTLTGSYSFTANLATQSYNSSDFQYQIGSGSQADYKIHRPLKAALYVDYYPIKNFLCLHLGGGAGIFRPFSDEIHWYPEYIAGLNLNLLGIVKMNLSTEYTDRVFVHQAGLSLNVRLIEITTGVSAQSSDFVKSFTGAGFGAYVYVTVGF